MVVKLEIKAGSLHDELVSFTRDAFEDKKEMFLHSLLCNSSSSLDRLQFEPEPVISIIPDDSTNILTIFDNGVGMTMGDLVDLSAFARDNLFMQAISSGDDLNIISQSGFAVYLAFLVADKVVVRTKSLNDEHYILKLQAGGASILTRDTSELKLDRGSRISLFLKEDQLEYLEDTRLEDLIKKYSSNISYQINLVVKKTLQYKVPFVEYEDDDDDEDDDEDDDDDEDEDDDDDDDDDEGMDEDEDGGMDVDGGMDEDGEVKVKVNADGDGKGKVDGDAVADADGEGKVDGDGDGDVEMKTVTWIMYSIRSIKLGVVSS